ncbi:MAG: hypothetical protein N3F66_05125 [Spirochaetes bacterium]|nr:hypothetical protein [Spirochaetota bacterium]
MKKPKKKSILKYFEPIDSEKTLSENFGSLDLEGSFGYFALSNQNKNLFLNRLNVDTLYKMIKKVGLVDHLMKIGFSNILIDVDKDDAQIHYLKIYYEKIDPNHLLIDLRVSESRFIPQKRFCEEYDAPRSLDMVVIEWLSAQNPKATFDANKPQLPGQSKPGLGSLNYMMELMYIVGEQVVKDGFMDVPDHFHGAVMYSRKFKFFNPSHEAILRAILRDIKGYSLSDMSWGMITGTIIDKNTNTPQVYDPSEQVFPVSKRMKDYFDSKKYKEKFKKIYESKKYYFDYEKMCRIREKMLQEVKPDEL